MNLRVLVVDDSSLFRRVISKALVGLPGIDVLGSAVNGKLALAKMASLQPDLITLDLEMPEMNGIEVLEAIGKAGMDTSAIMLSSLTKRGGELTIRALEAGAFDFITKPEGGSPEQNIEMLRESLRPVLQALGRKREIRSLLTLNSTRKSIAAPEPFTRQMRNIVLIGVSTGGPTALAQLLPALPAKIGAPIFIVQHMPALFTGALAERLQTKTSIHVKEAQDGECAQTDCAYLAPGGKQMKLAPMPNGQISIRITNDPPENDCRPSVDYLFRSAALHFPGRSIAVILTGMGKDGTEGLRLLKRVGSYSIAQDQASCVVFGMPREAIQAGVVDMVLPLSKIADSIVHALSGTRA